MPKKVDYRKKLTPEQYHVMFEKGTEPAFCGAFWNEKRKGKYYCAACNTYLFSSQEKFESGTGWPSFAAARNVVIKKDLSHGMVRDEVVCGKCGGHLGHVFDDGPMPSRKRYCINSLALNFIESTKQ